MSNKLHKEIHIVLCSSHKVWYGVLLGLRTLFNTAVSKGRALSVLCVMETLCDKYMIIMSGTSLCHCVGQSLPTLSFQHWNDIQRRSTKLIHYLNWTRWSTTNIRANEDWSIKQTIETSSSWALRWNKQISHQFHKQAVVSSNSHFSSILPQCFWTPTYSHRDKKTEFSMLGTSFTNSFN